MSQLNDESFYNILGEEISRNILVQQMINYYDLKRQVGETKLTDFNEGSEIRNLLESIAVDHYTILDDQNDLAKIAFIDTAEGEWLDKHGASPFINLPRIQGVEAQGEVTFTIPSALSSSVVIPEGTIVVSSETGLEFATDYGATINAGSTSTSATVTCLSTGADGNVASGSIDLIDDSYFDDTSVSVTNSSALINGVDEEDDFQYRDRLKAHLKREDFGSLPYYVDLAESVSGVHDAVLVDVTGYTKKVLVNGDSKPTPDTVLTNVLAAFTDTNNIVMNHTFTVDKPSYDTVNLSIVMNVTSEYTTTVLTSVLTAFFNGGEADIGYLLEFDGLKINDSITFDSVSGALLNLENIMSITSITANSNALTTLTPTTNHVFKLGTLSVTQNVVS